jgi:hypothetical protein
MKRRATLGAAALLVAWCPLARAESAGDWDWLLAPYIWGPSTSLDVTANDVTVINATATFKDLLDKTEFVFAIHFEGQCEHAGFLVDALFLNLGAEQTNTARPPLPGDTITETDVDIGVYEAAGFYRPGGRARGLDLIFGVRMFDYRTRIAATIPPPIDATVSTGTDKNFIDAFGGVRYRVPIGKRWDFLIRGDVGAGGTDLAWNALASFGVRLGKTNRYNLGFGWRHMELNVTAKDPQNITIDSNLTLTGPFLDFAIKF